MTVAVSPDLEALNYEYDSDNRSQRVFDPFSGETVYQFTYDENGNRIEKRDGSGALLESYVYDSKNRLVELHAGGQVTRYEYDPYDYRISQETNGEKTLYFLDGENIESIYDGRGKPKATFLRGAVIDEIIAAYHYDDHGQRQFYTYFHDGVTSVTALADHTGAIKQTYTYSPFGQDLASTGSTPNTLKYTGREEDPSGLYYYRARYYDPETRRFLTEDPLGLRTGDVNLYVYANNKPVRMNDPFGLFYIVGGKGFSLVAPTGVEGSIGGFSGVDEETGRAKGGLFTSVGSGVGINISRDTFVGWVEDINGLTINQNWTFGPFGVSIFFDADTGNLAGGTFGWGPSATPIGGSTSLSYSRGVDLIGPAGGMFKGHPDQPERNLFDAVYQK